MAKPENMKISKPRKEAGGLESVKVATEHIIREVGLVEGTKTLLRLNQFDGYDCPGCAWPDPDHHRGMAEFCENGAKAVAEEATDRLCDAAFFKKHTVQEMQAWTDFDIGKSGRIAEPMILREGADHYEPLSWQEAFRFIAGELHQLSHPDEAVFYTSGRTSNEAAFLYQLFVRMFGTNNLPDCSNMCHESSGVALTETLGIGKGSVTLDDFSKTELIIIMGQNPGTNHPRMLTALQQAKKIGAKIISVNPLPEAGLIGFRHPQQPVDLLGKATAITDLWLPVRINEDVALLKAILKILVAKEADSAGSVFDHEFIRDYTEGYEAFVNELNQYSLTCLVQSSGVEESAIRKAADLIASRKRIIVCWAMGLTQHKNAVDNIREIVNLLLLKGSIGKPGAGTCPVRGHSNVQGDRTMGIYERPKPEFLDSLQRVFGFQPPRNPGFDTVETIQAMAGGKVKVFFAMGGNFLSASPDTAFTAKALQQCKLTVQVSTKLNRSHLITGKTGIILPCLGRTELDVQAAGVQFVSVENSTGVVHKSQGGKKPASAMLLSEPKIVAELAKATLQHTDKALWDQLVDNYDRIRDLIEKTIPGFEHYNERVRNDGGFYLPNAAREQQFTTNTNRAKFTINLPASNHLKENELLMMTIRSHDQYNTTIYGLNDRYRGIYNGRRVIFMNEMDMKRNQLITGDHVNLFSHYDGVIRMAEDFVAVRYPIPERNVATYFPEANTLVPYNHYAHGSQTPISKSVVITVQKVTA